MSPYYEPSDTAPQRDRMTQRKRDALRVLADSPDRAWLPAAFATKFWPNKTWQRINGPYGLGPDSSGRAGARMLESLARMGLVKRIHHDCYQEYRITEAGLHIAKEDR